MSELAEVDIKVETHASVPKAFEKSLEPKSLQEQRDELRSRLQLNRRVLENKLIGEDKVENNFPRSAAMRFLSRSSTHQIIKKAASAALGIQTIKSLRYGYSLVKFLRSAFSHKKHSF